MYDGCEEPLMCGVDPKERKELCNSAVLVAKVHRRHVLKLNFEKTWRGDSEHNTIGLRRGFFRSNDLPFVLGVYSGSEEILDCQAPHPITRNVPVNAINASYAANRFVKIHKSRKDSLSREFNAQAMVEGRRCDVLPSPSIPRSLLLSLLSYDPTAQRIKARSTFTHTSRIPSRVLYL